MEFIFNETPDSVKTQIEFIEVQLGLDGPTGIMVTMMANKGINLANRLLDCDAAKVLENTYNSNEGLAKGKVNDANKIQKTIVSHQRNLAQNGKSVLTDMSVLGEYGYVIIDGKKVKISLKPLDIQTLMEAIKLKVDSFTAPPCPLTPYITLKGYILGDDVTAIGDAITLKSDAKQLRQNNVGITHTIALTMEPSEINLRDFAQVIHDVSPDDPALAAKYGFKTRNTSTVEKNQITKILPTEFKGLQSLAKLTLLENPTNQELWVRKGKKRTGAYVILPAKGSLLVTYGYGACTVENPSTTTPSQLSATVNKKAKAA